MVYSFLCKSKSLFNHKRRFVLSVNFTFKLKNLGSSSKLGIGAHLDDSTWKTFIDNEPITWPRGCQKQIQSNAIIADTHYNVVFC